MRFAFLFLVAACLCLPASALVTAYDSFEQLEGWLCENVQGIWICQSGKESEKHESVVLSIAAVATEGASIESYEEYLKQPRQIQDEDGKSYSSEVRYVRKRNLNGHVWVDSLQFNSELPGFWSRYVATVYQGPKVKLEILLTYVVSDDMYKQMAPQFERMVSSLKPNAEFDMNSVTRQGDGPLPTSEKLGPLQKNLIAERLRSKRKDPTSEVVSQGNPLMTIVLLLGAVTVAGFFIVKAKKKKAAQAAKGSHPTPPVKKVG